MTAIRRVERTVPFFASEKTVRAGFNGTEREPCGAVARVTSRYRYEISTTYVHTPAN
jgi:hypothetical protein